MMGKSHVGDGWEINFGCHTATFSSCCTYEDAPEANAFCFTASCKDFFFLELELHKIKSLLMESHVL